MKYSKDYSEYNDEKLIRLTVLIPNWLRDKLREKAYEERRTMTDIVTEAVEQLLDVAKEEELK